MNRGPQAGRSTIDHIAKATAAWGVLPEWVLILAEACAKANQSAVGRQLGYSPATISQVLSNSYRGDLRRIEEMVRDAFSAETVACPALGDLTRKACLDWQSKPYAPTSSHRVAMYRACRDRCPFSRIADGDHP